MAGPILGVADLAWRDGAPKKAGDEGELRLGIFDRSGDGGELGQHAVDQRRMCALGHGQPPAAHLVAPQRRHDCIHGSTDARNHHGLRPVDGGDGNLISVGRNGLGDDGFVGKNSRHRPVGRDGVHQP